MPNNYKKLFWPYIQHNRFVHLHCLVCDLLKNNINKMQSEIKLAPQNMHASHIRDKISQKIANTLKATASEEEVRYTDLIYLIIGRKLQQNTIRAFLNDIYMDQLEDVDRHWKAKLTQQKMLSDVYAIKRMGVEQQWTQVNINEKNIKQKQDRYKKYECSYKNRSQLNHRIKEISDNIKIIENNINMCKKDTQELKLRQQYNSMREQLRFLTNKSRKLKNLSQEKMINSSLTKSQEKLKDIQQRIQQITIEEKRLKQIQHLKYHKKSSTKSSQSSPKKSKYRLKKLEQIFIQFSRKQVKQFMLFDEIMKTHKYMSLQNYLRFVSSSGIGNQLSLDERVTIFKTASQFQSKISFLQFTEALKEICMRQCQKLDVKFEASILDTFLQQMVMRLQYSSRKGGQEPLLPNSNDFIKKLRSQVFSNYQFKIKSHTGKQKDDIKEYLVEKKKSNKTQPSINNGSKKSNVALTKLADNGSSSISRSGDKTQAFKTDNKFVKRKLTNNFKTVNVNQNETVSQSTSFKSSFEKDTYSNIFLRKRNKLKSQKKQQKVGEDYPSKMQLENPIMSMMQAKRQVYFNLTPATYNQTVQKCDVEELKDIVQLDEDDPFLTNHLSLNYSLKANKPPSSQSKYHF